MTSRREMGWKNVIVYADRREDSRVGLAKAMSIAASADGRVTVLDAVDGLPSQLPIELASLEIDRLVKSACSQRTTELVETLGALHPRVPTEIVVKAGVPAFELVRHALRTNADLIVKTALGRDVRRLTTFGSTALHLVRKSPVPVWLQNPRTPVARRVLAAVNLGGIAPEQEELGRRVLATARRVADLEGADLHVVYVVDMVRERLYRGLLTPTQFEAYTEAVLRASREHLDRFVQSAGRAAKAHVLQGDPKEVIADFVREHRMDLVVMGSVGRSGVAGLLIGEFAEELLCRVDCSVVTLKPRGFMTPITADLRATPVPPP